MSKSVFAAAAAAVLWGANFNLAVLAVAEMHPLTAGAVRFALAAAVMAGWAWMSGQSIGLRRHFAAYSLLGAVGVGGFNLLFFIGMQSTSAVNGALIMGVNPLVTAILAAAFLGERLSRRQILAIPAAALGVGAAVLGGGAHYQPAAGDALMIGANLCWALYNVLSRRLMPAGQGAAGANAGVMIMGAAVMAAAAFLVQAPLHMPSAKAASAVIVMAVGGSALAYVLWNGALKSMGASRTALFLNLVPVSAMFIAAATGDSPSPAQYAGAALVICAAVIASWPVAPRRITVSA